MNPIRSNLWKIYCYKFISDFWLIVPIIIPFYLSNGLTNTQVFVVQAAFSASALLFEVPSGYLSDVIGRKKTLIIGAILLPAGIGIYAVSHDFWQFVLAEIVLGIAWSMRSGTDSAIIYDSLLQLKEETAYKKIEGKAEAWNRIGTSVSSVLGGVLALASIRLPFYVNVVVALALFPLALSLNEPGRQAWKSKNSWKDILGIARFSLTHRQLIPVMLFSALIMSTGVTAIWGYFLYYQKLGLNVVFYGVIFAVVQLFSAVGAGRGHAVEKYIGPSRSIWLLAGIALVFMSFGIFHSKTVILLSFAHAFLWGTSTPLFLAYINKIISSDIRATVLSVSSMGGRLAFVILSPCFGRLVDSFSLSVAFLALGALFTAVGFIAIVMFYKAKLL
jgi:MFS family permease